MSETPVHAPRPAREAVKIYLPLALIAAAGFLVAWRYVEPAPPRTITISAGAVGGAYYSYAQQYKQILAESGIELEVLESAGAVENLVRLTDGEVDLGLVQGGLASLAPSDDLASLGSLYFEPLWIFARAGATPSYLSELEGRRVAIGPDGSGTQALARQILQASGVDESNAELLALDTEEAADRLLAGAVDAALFVAAPQSTLILELLESPQADLMTMRRYLSYRARYRFLSSVVLGEGMLDLERNIPAEDKRLLAAAATLVARGDLHPALTPVLLDAVARVHEDGDFFSEPGEFPSTRFVEFPMTAQAERYLEDGPSFLHRHLPFQWASRLDRLKILLVPLLTLLIPLGRIAPPIYQWRIRSKVYRWYAVLREIDLILEVDPRADVPAQIERLERLESEVNDINVPLSYMDEFYALRLHIHLVRQKLERAEKRGQNLS